MNKNSFPINLIKIYQKKLITASFQENGLTIYLVKKNWEIIARK